MPALVRISALVRLTATTRLIGVGIGTVGRSIGAARTGAPAHDARRKRDARAASAVEALNVPVGGSQPSNARVIIEEKARAAMTVTDAISAQSIR
eukprot:scaffold17148_cov31-Tisochrysis_lutea.AAC.2